MEHVLLGTIRKFVREESELSPTIKEANKADDHEHYLSFGITAK
jgi:hypothetical protein